MQGHRPQFHVHETDKKYIQVLETYQSEPFLLHHQQQLQLNEKAKLFAFSRQKNAQNHTNKQLTAALLREETNDQPTLCHYRINNS